MQKRRVAMATILVGAVVAVATVASGQRAHYGQHTWTDVSGFAGQEANYVLIPLPATNNAGDDILFGRALIGLAFLRRGDLTATFQVRARNIGKRGQTGLRRHDYWHRELWMPKHTVSSVESTQGYFVAVAHAENQYVTGINVCTTRTGNTSRDSLQGVRLFLSTHEGGNRLERVGTAEVARTDDCARWHDRQNCPSGSIATGVRMHHNGQTIRGIALRCTALEGRQ